MSAFDLHIVTPTSDFYSGRVEYVSVNTPDGRIGFLHGALPRIAVLSAGTINIKVGEAQTVLVCGDGIFRVGENGVDIVTSECRNAQDDVSDNNDDISDNNADNRDFKRAKVGIAVEVVKMNDKKRRDD